MTTINRELGNGRSRFSEFADKSKAHEQTMIDCRADWQDDTRSAGVAPASRLAA